MAYFPLDLLRVALLTASLASFITAGLMDADRGPLGSGRASEGWKYLYNIIALSPLPCVRIAHSKFDVYKILHITVVSRKRAHSLKSAHPLLFAQFLV